ncbi:hypothetical protein [Actinomycetospora atypica]|uniref:Uncharacterized protein n=1 Tax=Actinomycetospora atypica TaxID=1290095 RepID=A0ABV9YMQ0_9PSEU
MKNVLGRVAVAAAVAGVGLASTAGIASAAPSNSCSNTVKSVTKNSAGRTIGNVTGGSQTITTSNSCGNGNGNTIGSNNNIATAGGTIRNGNQTTITRTSTRTTNVSFDSFFGPGFPFN